MKVSKSIFVILLWKGQSQTFHVFLSQGGFEATKKRQPL
jgi:hypothetical protein